MPKENNFLEKQCHIQYYKLFFSRQWKGEKKKKEKEKKAWNKRNQLYISTEKQQMTQKIPTFLFIRNRLQGLVWVFFNEILSSDKRWSWTFLWIVCLQKATWGQKIVYDINRTKRYDKPLIFITAAILVNNLL